MRFTFQIGTAVQASTAFPIRSKLITVAARLLAIFLTNWRLAADEIRLIENRVGISQILAINSRGHAIGSKEVEIPRIGLGDVVFFTDGEREMEMPLLEGYSNVRPTAISDNDLVVGYCARAAGSVEGNMEACLWDPKEKSIVGLGRLPNHRGSHAFDISADGHLVVGYSTGPNPATMVPCIWQQKGATWTCEPLPTIHDYNPYLLSSGVVISDNGKWIAACITVEIIDRPLAKRYVSATYVWQRDATAKWQYRKRNDQQMRVANINDDGVIAGTCLVDRNLRACVLDADGQFTLLELPDGDTSSAATDINNQGIVVGYSDDPPGPDGGPTAFVARDGTLIPVEFPVTAIFSAANTINDAGQIGGYLVQAVTEDTPERAAAFILSTENTDTDG